MKLDHIVIAAADLAEAGRELEARHGLASIEGGRHPGWGTANRIVPLGDTYLELAAVVDKNVAVQTAFGRWVAGEDSQPRLLGWAVRTDDLEPVARRLNLNIEDGSRTTSTGQLLQWRIAGIEQAAAEPSLPFFIEWAQGTALPGRIAADHPAGRVEITRLVLTGDADRVARWLGDHRLPLTFRPGKPAVTAIVLSTAAGELHLDAHRL